MVKCVYCGAKVIKRLSTANAVRELTNCHNVFVNGEIYDKRNMTCYERQLSQQADLLRRAADELKDAESFYFSGNWIAERKQVQALLADLKALEVK